jgi:type IV fimbrial biogenesis protein FimT
MNRTPNRTLSRQPARRAHSRGLTLVESLAAMATMAIMLGSSLPSLSQMRDRRHLEGMATQISTDIHHARSLAVAHAASVRFSVQQHADGACYVIHTGHAGDCACTSNGQTQCRPGAQALRVVGFDAATPVRLTSTSANMLFDADRGTVTPTGTLRLSLRDGRGLNQVVNIMGRVRTCSRSGKVPGYPAC